MRVLIVAHEYPPIYSAGTERALKFAQHLPDFGFEALVLTTSRYGSLDSDHEKRVHRAADLVHNLFSPLRQRKASDLPQEMQSRVATISNSNWLGRLRDVIMIPDTKIGWLLPATKLGQALIEEYQPSLIFSTSPPETTHLVALQLSRKNNLPWIADMRDGWLFEPLHPDLRQLLIRRTLESWLESQMMSQASAVTAVTAPLADDLGKRYPQVADKIKIISNGYDQAEFAGLVRQRQPDGTFLLVHTGSVSLSRKADSADAFFTALAALVQSDPNTPLRVRFVGNMSVQEQATAHALGLSKIVTFIPPVSRREAHQHQLDADALLLITPAHVRSGASLKLFDYIGANIPMLALAEGNAAAGIVQQYGLGITAAPDDPIAITQAMRELMERRKAGEAWPGFAEAQAVFERRRLTSQLAHVFDRVLASSPKSP
ncbi:MAG: glycosyltransferase [Thermoflexales bacterium]|nr:glycosyltransferase [Thermoflexales bacterium]